MEANRIINYSEQFDEFDRQHNVMIDVLRFNKFVFLYRSSKWLSGKTDKMEKCFYDEFNSHATPLFVQSLPYDSFYWVQLFRARNDFTVSWGSAEFEGKNVERCARKRKKKSKSLMQSAATFFVEWERKRKYRARNICNWNVPRRANIYTMDSETLSWTWILSILVHDFQSLFGQTVETTIKKLRKPGQWFFSCHLLLLFIVGDCNTETAKTHLCHYLSITSHV